MKPSAPVPLSEGIAVPLETGISVVVPVYNSQESLPLLASELSVLLPQLAERHELILVNDGSRDESWDVIRRLVSQHAWIRGINLMRNYGQHNALLCGIRAAGFDVVVTLDDDLQNPPAEIRKLLEKLAEGFDVVYGVPIRQQHGFWRDFASLISRIVLSKAMGAEIARNLSAFRAFRTVVRNGLEEFRGPYVSIDVLLTWSTTRFSSVVVDHHPRRLGESGYSFGRLASHALNMMTGFSTVPLRLASITGFVFTLFGFATLLYVVGRYIFQGSAVPGFPFLASQIAILSGAQLFAIGILGEYMARMHFRSMDRPAYVVRGESEAIERREPE